jgi:HAE1 family hydrophobic/amphiphilic exporter-1
MDVNVEKAQEANIAISDIFITMQAIMVCYMRRISTSLVNQYRSMIQAKPEDSANLEYINNIYNNNNTDSQ